MEQKKKKYVAPQAELLSCRVEKGFEISTPLDPQIVDLGDGGDVTMRFT